MGAGASTYDSIGFYSDSFQVFFNNGSSAELLTTQVFRDPSSWYHFVVAVDTTQATSSNRIKLYVNGSQITAFGTSTYPSQNYDTQFNTAEVHRIGTNTIATTRNFDGYITETNFIDGQALTPSSFGQTNASTGVWEPINYTGTYGTNGFELLFADNSGTTSTTLGADTSGNGNNWTPNNFSVTAGAGNDSLVDSPTSYGTDTGVGGEVRGNYCTLNPLDNGGTAPLNGNLELTAGAAERGVRSTFAIPTTGLYYAEALVGTNQSGATDIAFGFVSRTTNLSANPSGISNGWLCYATGTTNITRNGTSTLAGAGTALVSGDVLQLAIDLANNKGWLGKNNTWFNGTTGTDGNPSTGANPTFTFSNPPELFVLAHCYLSTINVNFGQRPFAYTAPSGFKALCTQNLPTPTIGATSTTQANDYFDTTLYTGTGSDLAIVNSGGMAPDFVWVKVRNQAFSHNLNDIIRGTNNRLQSDTTAAAGTPGIVSFNSNGFTTNGSAGELGTNGNTYVAWQWKGGGTGVTNTAGSITSTVSASTTSGFSIVTYTGTGANATVGHGLGVAPSMIIVKDRTQASTWWVYNSNLGNTKYLELNATAAAGTSSAAWNNTSPTSTVFSVGTNTSESAKNYVAYCFAPVAGYSAFGSYTGNGSADGPFVYTGFRPRYVLIKSSSNVEEWHVHDTARDTYNLAIADLYPNSSSAEVTNSNQLDILSNGFKCRSSNSGTNGSGYTFIYAAFAENPFKYSLAR
jgi:hypothetical protein